MTDQPLTPEEARHLEAESELATELAEERILAQELLTALSSEASRCREQVARLETGFDRSEAEGEVCILLQDSIVALHTLATRLEKAMIPLGSGPPNRTTL